MPLAEDLRARIGEAAREDRPPPPPEADARLGRLAGLCPVYRKHLEQYPLDWAWLELPKNRDDDFRFSAFLSVWREDFAPAATSAKAHLAGLQRYRRLNMMRIAYREVTGLAPPTRSFAELTLLAEFCLREVLHIADATWRQRLGKPINGETGKADRTCILGLGKFGGQELNFWSDLDLIYVHEGAGQVVRNGRETPVSNREFWNRYYRDVNGMLSARSPFGQLYNIDMRLRPEGDGGPLVRNFSAMANYYWAQGQTWERLAWLRARTVAGELNLGAELLEELHPFRYPRYPPPQLLQEVGGVKVRTEKEVVGKDQLERDIKSGRGGIREIEFQVQALQLIHAGRNPFLQGGNTLETIGKLERYGFFEEDKARFLREAYLFLRTVENRLQMRDESRIHQLPEDPEARTPLAEGMGLGTVEAFDERLDAIREQVRRFYRELFAEDPGETERQDWTVFLTGQDGSRELAERLDRWFPHSDNRAGRLRVFALGGRNRQVTREIVSLFLGLARNFDDVLPQLARPLRTLERVGSFAESYGARKQFFKACSENPRLFEVLCLLFDRSRFIHELLCQHPGIMEELLYEAAARDKDLDTLSQEIERLPSSGFTNYLWLYVRAEQVRLAIAELLHGSGIEETEDALSQLAEAALRAVLRRADPQGRLAVIALGKFGGRELTFGSDLDILFVGEEGDQAAQSQIAAAVTKQLQHHRGQGGRLYEVDLRLRPHGQDGPLVTTPGAMQAYHDGGSAQAWERQILTRARFVGGNEHLGEAFVRQIDATLYSRAARTETVDELWAMRLRAEREKGAASPSWRAFKAAPGGIMDIESAAQIMQLIHGHEHSSLQRRNTRQSLRAAAAAGVLPEKIASACLERYALLRRLELYLRRDTNRPVTTLSEDPRGLESLAKWTGFENAQALTDTLESAMNATRSEIASLLNQPAEARPAARS